MERKKAGKATDIGDDAGGLSSADNGFDPFDKSISRCDIDPCLGVRPLLIIGLFDAHRSWLHPSAFYQMLSLNITRMLKRK